MLISLRIYLLLVTSVLLLKGHTLSVTNPTIRLLSVEGNNVFSAPEILRWMSLREGIPSSPALLAADRDRIEERYTEVGYLACQVSMHLREISRDSSSANLIVQIAEGTQSLFGTVAVAGNRSFTAEAVLEVTGLFEGDPFGQERLERGILEILSFYERNGYPFAECSVGDVTANDQGEHTSVDISLRIVEGRFMTMDEIRVEGNTSTDAAVVVREARLSRGEKFSIEKVERVRSRLQRLAIFAEVSEPQLFIHESTGGLLIRVREGNTNTFDGIVGYIPGSISGESGYVTGLVNVGMRNLFGTGRKLNLRWQREDRFSQELGFRYLEPWIFGIPLNLSGGFFQRQQDTTYVRRVIDGKGDFLFSEELSFGLLFSTTSVIPSSDSLDRRVFRSSAVGAGVEVDYDTRDDLFGPTKGIRARADYQYARKRVTVPSQFAATVGARGDLQKITVDLELFLRSFSQQVIALSWHGREVQGDLVEESEMFRFGGAASLRGYRENQFLGAQMFWSNAEYRLMIARRSFAYLFFDLGFYRRPGDSLRGMTEAEGVLYGYGLGVQLETALGMMGVSFALGKGDSFSNGKIHFRLINDF